MTTEKFCTRCGKKFIAVGREVICPSCKEQAAEDAKRAAVLKAKRASWNGESVPVRISGRASTIIRHYGAANGLPFAEALDALLKGTEYFKSTGSKWEDITPYKSRRRGKSTTENTSTQDTASKQEAPQAVVKQDAPQASKQAAKVANKNTTSKTSASKAAGKAGKKA